MRDIPGSCMGWFVKKATPHDNSPIRGGGGIRPVPLLKGKKEQKEEEGKISREHRRKRVDQRNQQSDISQEEVEEY